MNDQFGMPRDLAHAWVNLVSLVDDYAERQPIPCRIGDPPIDAWTSTTATDQAIAAAACRRCPALIQCRRYGLENPREVGVYGGLTEKERRATARARKERK